jgi:cell division protein FtsQ
MIQKRNILKWVFTTAWCLAGAGVLTLLVAAIQKEDGQKCAGLNIIIKGVSNNFFVDKNDILNELNQYIDGSPEGQPMSYFNLKSLESDLKKNIWVKQSQLFFDNNRVLQIIVTEREPAARVFTTAGTTFYIDSSITMLPLSEKFSARLPVFTGFPSDKSVLSKKDSALLRNVYQISMAIQEDSFIMALVEQVDITPQRMFEMVPKIGDGMIAFGDGNDIDKKFSKLKLFYEQVMPATGWGHYSSIDVQYAGQVVAKRKGAEDKTTDSLRTLQIMQMIAQTAEHLSNDSLQLILQDNEHNTTSTNLVEQSIQRDDEPATMDESPVVKIIDRAIGGAVLTANPALAEPATAKTTADAKKPAVKATAKKATVVKSAAKQVTKTSTNKPVVKPAVAKPAAQKPATNKTMPALNKPKPVPVKAISDKPKAVMPKAKQNDY